MECFTCGDLTSHGRTIAATNAQESRVELAADGRQRVPRLLLLRWDGSSRCHSPIIVGMIICGISMIHGFDTVLIIRRRVAAAAGAWLRIVLGDKSLVGRIRGIAFGT